MVWVIDKETAFYLLPGHPLIPFGDWLRSPTRGALCQWSCQGTAASSLD